ncbi:DinB family protein [Bacillus timonensis]|nr:DinB family protein [Bacillus timonensis]
MERINDLLHYHKWANKTLLKHLHTLPVDFFTQQLQSIFPSVANVFEHLYEVDVLWLNRLKGENETDNALCFSSIEEVENAYLLHNQECIDFAQKLLNGTTLVTYQNSKGETFENSYEEILQHIVNHGTNHRGNIGAMMRQYGHKGVGIDYIMYLRQKK